MIPFNVPPQSGDELKYFKEVLANGYFAGDGPFCRKCEEILATHMQSKKVFLMPSGTAALEMACMLADLKPEDEIIVPSYTFSTSAASAVMFGATPVFVDIRKDTLNIDETKIEEAITPKTKAIMVVHYGGVACEMDYIMALAHKYNLFVIEDAAQGLDAYYKGKHLGTIGDFGCFSFHATKNISMGEGGCISINRTDCIKRAYPYRDSGTDVWDFENGLVSAYSWVDRGSSFLPSEFQCAYLYGQLLKLKEIQANRLACWQLYYDLLKDIKGLQLPFVPKACKHNAHMFYIKVASNKERERLRLYLKENGVQAVFHYSPLHNSKAGLKYGRYVGTCENTISESSRLLRLPMYYGLKKEQVEEVARVIHLFYQKEQI